MKKQKNVKKLRIDKETLLPLESRQMKEVVGGWSFLAHDDVYDTGSYFYHF